MTRSPADIAADLRRYAALPDGERSPAKLRRLLNEAADALAPILAPVAKQAPLLAGSAGPLFPRGTP